MVLAPSLCGRLATAAGTMTTVTAMATQTVSTRCQLAVLQRTALCRGTPRPVLRRWPQHTAAALSANDRL